MHTLSAPKPYRVGIVPHTAYSLAYGGMEVQQAATINALGQIGVEAVQFDMWSRTLDVDVVHVFGSEYPHTQIIDQLKQMNIPIVSTAMFMPERPIWMFQLWRYLDHILPQTTYTLRRRSFVNSSAVVALSEQEKRQVSTAFHIPSEKIHVIANGVDESFFNASPDLFVERFGVKDFVLCVGSIEPRKNQLTLAQAMVENGSEVIFIGKPSLHGGSTTAKYVDQFSSFVASHNTVHWINGLEHNDPLLASAYSAATAHVLISTAEAQGLVSLEAAAAGTPIVVTDTPTLREIFMDGAMYTNPNNIGQIIQTVNQAITTQRSLSFPSTKPSWLLSWVDVAHKLDQLYRSIFAG